LSRTRALSSSEPPITTMSLFAEFSPAMHRNHPNVRRLRHGRPLYSAQHTGTLAAITSGSHSQRL
jgi:hypothetical protein